MTPEERDAALVKIAEAAVAAEIATGCPAELSAAQCILESAWLRVAPGNNCFGIKNGDRYPGAQYKLTREFLNGAWRVLKLAFEVYPNLADCFIDHARLITGGLDPARPNVYGPAWRKYLQDRNLEAFIAAVARHYATDPEYSKIVAGLVRGPKITAAVAAARVKQAQPV